jgi:hypothetical protein
MPSFKGNERPLSEACWRLSDPSATSGLCSSFGKRGRTSRQSFCVDPCLPVESSDEPLPAGALFGPGDALFSTPVHESRTLGGGTAVTLAIDLHQAPLARLLHLRTKRGWAAPFSLAQTHRGRGLSLGPARRLA